MKRLALVSGILALALIGLAVNSPADNNNKNCEDRLVGNLYMCQGVDRNGTPYDFELLFGAANESSFPVELLVFNESAVGACGCQVEGSLRRPRFDRSDNFICALQSGDLVNQTSIDLSSIALAGEVDNKKIEDGQFFSIAGFNNSTLETLQLFYECKMVQ